MQVVIYILDIHRTFFVVLLFTFCGLKDVTYILLKFILTIRFCNMFGHLAKLIFVIALRVPSYMSGLI